MSSVTTVSISSYGMEPRSGGRKSAYIVPANTLISIIQCLFLPYHGLKFICIFLGELQGMPDAYDIILFTF